VDRSPQDASIFWNDAPGPFNVYRGSTQSGTAWAYNQTCLSASAAGPLVVDSTAPPSSALFWYLVTRRTACGESIPGRKGDGSAIPSGSPCP
jgi:hypothetical protein